ncbi:MAG: YitT family protein [Lachnospiraceae bacterium]|nr:YitT family protein [Lachnospiraceae bacterium]
MLLIKDKDERWTKLKGHIGVRACVIAIASLIMALNINTFVHTGGLLPGGATGLTLLIQEIFAKFFHTAVPYTLINVLINSIPIYIGFRYIGRRFTLLSCGFILLTSLLTDLLPAFEITQDILLISIFGGLINGTAISICLLMDATSGGTDFVAIYLSEKRGIDSFNLILLINAGILVAAGLLFSWDKALYSIIFQFTSTATIHTLYRKYQQVTLFIVTNKPDEVSAEIFKLGHHGATLIPCEGSYKHDEHSVVYSVVSRGESGRVVSAVKEADPAAFVNVVKTDRVIGQFYRRPTD